VAQKIDTFWATLYVSQWHYHLIMKLRQASLSCYMSGEQLSLQFN